jgi:hypothetical protein
MLKLDMMSDWIDPAENQSPRLPNLSTSIGSGFSTIALGLIPPGPTMGSHTSGRSISPSAYFGSIEPVNLPLYLKSSSKVLLDLPDDES